MTSQRARTVTGGGVITACLAVMILVASGAAAAGQLGTTRGAHPAVRRQRARVLPPVARCVSARSTLLLRIQSTRRGRLRSAVVYVNDKRAARLRGTRLRHRVRIDIPPFGSFTVRIVAHRPSGRRVVVTRRYRRCSHVPGSPALGGPTPGLSPSARVSMPGCAPLGPSAWRGDWPMYGHDLSGDRYQPAEHSITPDQAPNLKAAFVVSVTALGMDGAFEATPVESNGCVYMGTSTGWVLAVNADSGKLIWKTKLPVGAPGLLGTGIVGSPTVADGKVIIDLSQADTPYAAAFDQATGRLLWRTTVENQPGAYNDASPAIFDGMVFVGFNGDEEQPIARGGFTLLDETTGAVIAKTYTIPDEAYKQGYNGASMWATAAVDPVTRYAYVGTGNPQGPSQYKYANAIVKIDLDRRRPTFAKIVGYYPGTPDAALPVEEVPTCQAAKGQIVYVITAACTHQDVDFGASPQLFRDASGRQVVGELQKSGIYHVAHTDDMSRAWATKVGDPGVITNGGTGATDGRQVYVEGTPPGEMFALDAGTGASSWQAPVGDQIHFESTTVAAGVVYTIDGFGNLRAWRASDGTSLVNHPITADTGPPSSAGANNGGPGSDTSVSVSVARGTVYAALGGDIVAYRVRP